LKWLDILPEVIAFIGGLIILFICINLKKNGQFTFLVTFTLCSFLYIMGNILKSVIKNTQ